MYTKRQKSITCAQLTLHIFNLTKSVVWVTNLSDTKAHTLSTSVFKHPSHHLLLNTLIWAFLNSVGLSTNCKRKKRLPVPLTHQPHIYLLISNFFCSCFKSLLDSISSVTKHQMTIKPVLWQSWVRVKWESNELSVRC